MKLGTRLAWMLVLVLVALIATVRAAQFEGRRFYVNTVLSWWPNSKDLSLFQKCVDESKQKGMNAISIDVPWSIERKDGTYDFSDLNVRLNYIISKRLTPFVRLNMSTAGGQRPYWLTDNMLMATADGKIYSLPDGTTFPSLAHPVVLRKAQRFAQVVAKNIASRYGWFPSGEYAVAAVIPAINPQMTLDYPVGAEVDYSAAAKANFVRWARGKYRSIARIDSEWNTDYKNWSDVHLAEAPAAARELYYSFTIRRMFDRIAVSVRTANPNLDVALQTRAAWEEPSSHSLLLTRLAERADWVIISDLPQANHSFTADLVRTAAMGRKVATEMDTAVHINATNARYFNQGVRSFEHGASGLIVANWDLTNIRNNDGWPFLRDVGRLARVQTSSPRPNVAIYLSVWDLVNGVAKLEDYLTVYDQVTDGGKVAVDILTDPVIAAKPGVLMRYKEIYLPANWTIPQNTLRVLRSHAARLKVSQPLVAGTLNEFGAHQSPLMGSVANGK